MLLEYLVELLTLSHHVSLILINQNRSQYPQVTPVQVFLTSLVFILRGVDLIVLVLHES